jgi:hypothetical protein
LQELAKKLKVSESCDIKELGVRFPTTERGSVTLNFTSGASSIRLGWVTKQGWWSDGGAATNARDTIRAQCSGRYDVRIKNLGDGRFEYSITLSPELAGARIDLGTRTYLLSCDPKEHEEKQTSQAVLTPTSTSTAPSNERTQEDALAPDDLTSAGALLPQEKTSDDLDKEIEEKEQEIAELHRANEEAAEELKQVEAEYYRIKTDTPLAQLTVLEQTGLGQKDNGIDEEKLKTKVSFSLLAPDGSLLPGKETEVTGSKLYVQAHVIKFNDELIQSGEVPGHPTRFVRLHGSNDIPSQGLKLETRDHPAGVMSAEEENFLRFYTGTPAGTKPSWEGFWHFTEVSPLLQKYKENRQAFWQGFFRFADESLFWDLANDTALMSKLDVRAAHGASPVVDLLGAENGSGVTNSVYTFIRRNLGGLDVSFPQKKM